jgi:hypothetical protein
MASQLPEPDERTPFDSSALIRYVLELGRDLARPPIGL